MVLKMFHNDATKKLRFVNDGTKKASYWWWY